MTRKHTAQRCGPLRQLAFGAKDIAVEIGDPRTSVRRDIEIADLA